MQVIKADVLGFCMGVRRAVDIALDVCEKYPAKDKYTFGPLIHNPVIVKELENKGCRVLDDISVLDSNSVVVIRAHGAPAEDVLAMKNRGAQIVDATCPRVQKSARLIESVEDGEILLVGDSGHGEVKALSSVADKVTVVLKPKDIPSGIVGGEISILAQTTVRKAEFDLVVEAVKECYPHKTVNVFNTICPATKKRQESLIKMCASVDCVVVVGGKSSANTRRLADLVVDFGIDVWQVEDVFQLEGVDLSVYKTIGVTAGASTPDSSIDEVINFLHRRF
jgi:4-hydroxy-3-methylbut-2-enyl diphosphate reductase